MSRVGTINSISATWWVGLFTAMKANPDGCWEWPFGTDGAGYGRVRQGGRYTPAHRIAYEVFVGPVPDGLEIDHLCRVRGCFRWDHLEAVPHRVNVLRGEGPAAVNARKAECPRGHPLAGENLIVRADGRRNCRTCRRVANRAAKRAWKARRRAAKETTE